MWIEWCYDMESMRHATGWSGREETPTTPRFPVQMIEWANIPLAQLQNTGAAHFGVKEGEWGVVFGSCWVWDISDLVMNWWYTGPLRTLLPVSESVYLAVEDTALYISSWLNACMVSCRAALLPGGCRLPLRLLRGLWDHALVLAHSFKWNGIW